ncbi:MAG: hypothetical protein WCA37_10000 [Terracidiphilus sp.]
MSTVAPASNVTEMPRPVPSPVAEAAQAMQAPQVESAQPVASEPAQGFSHSLTEGSLAKAPETAAASGILVDTENLRQAVVQALEGGGHASAAQLLGAAVWSVDGASVRIETAPMGKKMLSLTVNAAAEKMIRQELQKLGAPARFLVVPGAGGAPAPRAETAPMAGSVQEAALANPLVQKAKEIFKAEVRSVVDLRSK